MVYVKKVSLYLDEKLWARFKESVLERHGTLRMLSNEVEDVLRSSLIDAEYLGQEFRKIGVEPKTSVSSQELKEVRPKLRGPPSEVLIRSMRRKRLAKSISRQ